LIIAKKKIEKRLIAKRKLKNRSSINQREKIEKFSLPKIRAPLGSRVTFRKEFDKINENLTEFRLKVVRNFENFRRSKTKETKNQFSNKYFHNR
jgi:hypothetical protein